MKSLQLIKATVVKNAVIAISIYYAIILAFLIFAIFIMHNVGVNTAELFSMLAVSPESRSEAGSAQIFLFIFAIISVQYMFKFSQNVCVSRKTCFLSAIYTVIGLSLVTIILDIFIMIFAKITIDYDMSNVFLTIIVITSIYIVQTMFGMLVGIVWYRLSKFTRICVAIGTGIFFMVGMPLLAVFVVGVTTKTIEFPTWIIDVGNYLGDLFYAGDMRTALANICLAAVLAGIFYLVIRKAQIKDLK